MGRACRSLALAVYRDLYPKQPLDINPAGRMEIVWGTKHRSDQRQMDAPDRCGWHRPSLRSRHRLRSSAIFLAFFDPAEVRSRCPYEGVIPVAVAAAGRATIPTSPSSRQNRIVFYGAALEGVQDKSFTPVNGMIASVFVHAMALDNLITFDGRPEQNVLTVGGAHARQQSDPDRRHHPGDPDPHLDPHPQSAQHARRRREAGSDGGAVLDYLLDKFMENGLALGAPGRWRWRRALR